VETGNAVFVEGRQNALAIISLLDHNIRRQTESRENRRLNMTGASAERRNPSYLDEGEVFYHRTRHRIVYLACPYSHADASVRRKRYELATAAAATLVKQGVIVFSPITMTHPLDVALAGETSLGSEFWVKFDEAFMDVCYEMIILKVDGWEESSGIRREMDFFEQEGKPISYMALSEVENVPGL
jgi:hypothetical protein